ncbi:MAG: polysaccharide deacetylase family protein [Micromonosporaceae bacterium]
MIHASPGHRPAGRPTTGGTVVSLTFDDSDADQMQAARIMRTYGITGTFYIISGAIGAPGYMTMGDLRTLAAAGDEIGGHTVSHLSLPQISLAEARRQVCDSRNVLRGWGYRVRSFAYPDATYDRAAERIVQQCGFDSARIGNGIRNGRCPRCTVAERVPPPNRYTVRTPGQVDITWSLKELERTVARAQRRGGGWVPFVFHHICDGGSCGRLSISTAKFTAFVRWLTYRTRAGIAVRNVGDVVRGPVRPRVPAPPARPHGVVNAGLESVGTFAGVSTDTESTGGVTGPVCWMEGGYGQNMVRWQRVRDGIKGGWAERIIMTSHKSGDAKLLQQFDLGQCSIPVTQHRPYLLATWYKSTVRTQFCVYYRNPSGTWKYWRSSPFFPPAAHWTRATWQTPAIPRGGSGLSFGLDLAAVGSLTTDGYSVSKPTPNVGRLAVRIVLLLIVSIGAARGFYTHRSGITRVAGRLASHRWRRAHVAKFVVEQPIAHGERYGLKPRVHTEFGEQCLDVSTHSSAGDTENIRHGSGT